MRHVVKLSLAALWAFFALSVFINKPAVAYSGGPDPGNTGAPNEITCASCHSGGSSGGSLAIAGVPATYTPGQEYNLTVTLIQSGRIRFGFQATVLDTSGNRAGTLMLTDTDRTQLRSSTASGVSRDYIDHTLTGTSIVAPDTGSWNFKWRAPSTGGGAATFYVAGNAANGDFTSVGDNTYTILATSSSPNPPDPAPSILSLTPSFRLSNSPGFQLVVLGNNFSSSSKVLWNGGERSPIFVASTELRVQVDAFDIALPGTASVQVSNPAPSGGLSNSVQFDIRQVSVARLLPSMVIAGGPSFTLVAYGHNFDENSVVHWNGSARTTVFYSDSELWAIITAPDISSPGLVPVSVVTSSSGGVTSNSIAFPLVREDCTFALLPQSRSFSSSGGDDTFQVSTQPGCAWSVTSSPPWVVINSSQSGIGLGLIDYSVLSNLDEARFGTISIAGKSFTARQGAKFADVDPSDVFYEFIGKLSAARVTLGCGYNALGQPLYCPDTMVTREQMAAFIMRALGEFSPPQPASQRFLDVPPSNIFYSFINRLANRQITLGCGDGTIYCPQQEVTREQMAAFIMRALGEFSPPQPASQRFLDVPPTNVFYPFIDRMAILQITLGCGTGSTYCPLDYVTRGQMAAFLVRAFGL